MSEILQSQETVKLFEYDYNKPDLAEEDVLAHHGVKGQKWGVIRRSRKSSGGRLNRKKTKFSKETKKLSGVDFDGDTIKKKYATKEDAIKAKDLKYIKKHQNEFSTQELNQVMNRIDAETRLDKMVKNSGTKGKVKRIIKSPQFKIIATIAIGSLLMAGVDTYARGRQATKNDTYIELMGGKQAKKDIIKERRKGFAKDVGKYAARGTANMARKEVRKYTDIFNDDPKAKKWR